MNDHHPREIQLTSKQLVFVFMSTVLVAVVVFLLGVWVGRGIDTGSMAATEDVMGGGLPKSGPANPSSPGGGPPAAGDQKPYSYPGALTGGSGSGAATAGASPAATPPPPADPPASDPAPASPPTQPPSPPPAPPSEPEKAQEKAKAQASDTESWVIQVGAFSAKSGAEKVAAEYKGKGYPVTVSAGPTFRVWIGPYPKKAAAEQIAIRLRKEGKDASVTKPR
jgi:cell division septation protein DedD